MIFELADDELLLRPLWAAAVKYRAAGRCEICGKTPLGTSEDRLHAHHVDVDEKNHRLSNGQALCSMCHGTTHNALRAQEEADAAAGVGIARRRYPWLGNASSEAIP